MKRNHNLGGAVPLVLSAALCAFTPALLAQSGAAAPSQDQPSQAQPQEQPQQTAPQQSAPQQQDAQETKTFAGKIMKLQNGNFALVTGQTPQGQPAGHFLDNQDEAKKWEGKQVTVTGTLELASNTIHIAKIEAA